MIKHYFKTAIRNLKKYKQQNIISIIGLAIGFVCFALSILWIHYELTYDNFHKGADRIYRVRQIDKYWTENGGFCPVTSYRLFGYLQQTFPEVEAACVLNGWNIPLKVEDRQYTAFMLQTDSSFYSIFDAPLIEGNLDFLKSGSQAIAITPKLALRLFGTEKALGKKIKCLDNEMTVEAIVQGWSDHSTFPFECITATWPDSNWGNRSYRTYIRLKKNVSPEALEQKIRAVKMEEESVDFTSMTLTPLAALHYSGADNAPKVKLEHVFLFALAGMLVILCSLFNYLTLFLNCLKIRSKEFALRKINGASNSNLFILLLGEITIILLFAIIIGIILIEWMLPQFKELSDITSSPLEIYLEALGYGILIILASILLILIPVLFYFRRQTLYISLKEMKTGHNKNLFRKVSIVFQLLISIGFIYCTTIIYRQTNYVVNADTGIDQKNTGCIYCERDKEALFQELKQLPVIEEIIQSRAAFIPANTTSTYDIKPEEKSGDNDPSVECEIKIVDASFIPFYNIPFVEGKTLSDNSGLAKEVVINETAAKAFGWHTAVGKKLLPEKDEVYTVIGVVKDFYYDSPLVPIKPMVFVYTKRNDTFIFRYYPNEKEKCKQAIDDLFTKKFPDINYSIYTVEDTLKEYVKSETSLLSMLSFVSIVCIAVSLFGIYSLASLTCEKRKKEIAIRKTLGANTTDILLIFYREFFTLLSIASILAFSIGYLIMKPWTEQYIRRITIGPEIYINIFISVLLCIMLTIGWLVWRTARTNPADVIRNE